MRLRASAQAVEPTQAGPHVNDRAEAQQVQRDALALVHAIRFRAELPESAPYDMLRAACHDHDAIAVILSLAALVPAVALRLEALVGDLLADPDLLRACAAAAEDGTPLEPGGLGLTASDALAQVSTASAVLAP